MEDRIRYELTSVLPFGSNVVVRRARDPCLDAWKGGSSLAAMQDSRLSWMTRAEYEEMGVGYFKEHVCSNRYVATPEPRP
mmetsp:Transcript_48412/g.116172  ORF Transcript_48412/g.116172 Transcript_48412/m.116172 type:complete len:80 (-) Transcript_48412:32-271(-)